MKIRALAAAIAVAVAVMVASGCSSVQAASHPHAAGGGVPGYWTRSRMLGARPVRGLRYQPGKPANAHTVRCLPRSAGCLPVGLAVRVTCVNPTSRQSATQLRFDCGGYTGGTSGSPWVTSFNARTGTGTIVGVIGGYQQGGDTPAVFYSSYL